MDWFVVLLLTGLHQCQSNSMHDTAFSAAELKGAPAVAAGMLYGQTERVSSRRVAAARSTHGSAVANHPNHDYRCVANEHQGTVPSSLAGVPCHCMLNAGQ